MQKKEILSYIKNAQIIIISVLFLVFPIFFLTVTTDFFVFPKQVLVIAATVILMLLWGARQYYEGRITVKSHPFTIPVALLGVVVLLSAILSTNAYDALTQAVPFVFIIFLFFTLVNSLEDKNSFNMALSSLILGGVLSALISLLYYFKIYILPFSIIQNQYFNTFGSTVQHISYLIPLLIIASFYLIRKDYKKMKFDYSFVFQAVTSAIILAGVGLVTYQIVTLPQKPILLPYIHGFQISLAAISQDAPRLVLSFLFGSGYGTFITDFTRFKLPSFNQEQALWNLSFSYSSSFFLELLTVTGLLGALSYLFLFIRVAKTRLLLLNPLFTSLFVTFLLSFFLPFSFSLVFLLFVLLALYVVYLYLEEDKRVYEVVLSLVALQKGLISFNEAENFSERRHGREISFLPVIFIALVLIVGSFVGYYAAKLVISDIKFSKSLQRELLTNGQKIYELQKEAIATYPLRSDYYRIFSQVNLALANSLISNTPQGSSPSAETQKTVLQLLQQSIESGRAAVARSPLTSINWQNLAQIYRALINVGQNAEQFATNSMQQAILLDPSNPQLRIELGGIYYQLGGYELAQNQFLQAVSLKPDLANAHYNLGHALEAKGDLKAALDQYLLVKQLVQDNKDSVAKMDQEVGALETKLGGGSKPPSQTVEAGAGQQPPLEISSPSAKIPPQRELKVPPPPKTSVPTPTAAPSPTPAATSPTPTTVQ